MTDVLDALLDATLDDLADLAEFKPFPPGAHKALATFEAKSINEKPCVELSFKYVEVIDCEAEEPPKEGDTASTLFFLDNEFGQGAFKNAARSFAGLLPEGATNREIIEAVQDIEVIILTSYAKNKKDPDSPYMNVKEIEVI
jgi:hypothetical protein